MGESRLHGEERAASELIGSNGERIYSLNELSNKQQFQAKRIAEENAAALAKAAERAEKEPPKSTVFDMDYYGVSLRSARRKAGFSRAEEFCKTVSTWTGVVVNKETLYRIEQGVQPPTVEQVIAFGIILFRGSGGDGVVRRLELARCFTPYAEFLSKQSSDLDRVMTYDGHSMRHDKLEPGSPYDDGASFIDEYYQSNLDTSDPFDRSEAFVAWDPVEHGLPETVVRMPDGMLVDLGEF